MTISTFITASVFIIFGILALGAIQYRIAEYNDFKLRKNLFVPGRIVNCLRCKSKTFNDYEVDSSFIICDVINDEISVRYKSGFKTYKKLMEIGDTHDAIEVYNSDNSLVGKYGHKDSSILFYNFLTKID